MPLRPSTPYAAAKVAVESYLQAFARAHVLAPRILRYGNVFGPRQNAAAEAGVVAIFSRALLTGAPVRLHGRCVAGDGGCRRDYVYVDDVVSANLVALRGDLTPGVYNVGTGVGRRTEEVLRAVAEAAGVEPAIQHCEPRPGDLQEAVLSARRLEASGWRPAVDFATGIARTVHWFATEGSLSAHMPPGSCTGA
jgi:UDP-glucose 4-epimerase